MPRQGWAVRIYRALLALLPGEVEPWERDQMATALEDQLRHASDGPARRRIVVRAFGRLPGAVGAEWVDRLRGRPDTGGRRSTSKGGGWDMGTGISMVRQALRSLRRSPAFALAATLLVGLGVGAVTAVFTVVDHVLLRPLPYPDEDRLVYMTNGSHAGPVLRALDGLESVDAWTALSGVDANLIRDDSGPLRLQGIEVSRDFLPLLDARPALGRLLAEGDGNDVVVLTHPAWSNLFGADPGVVGSTLRFDGRTVEVVGVLSREFHHPEAGIGRALDFLQPMDWQNPLLDESTVHRHTVMARLRPGIGLQAANAELDALAVRLAGEYPEMLTDRYGGTTRFPFIPLRDAVVGEASVGLRLVLGAVSLLLMVACANVAHLFLARGLERRREVALRRALGAGTGSLLAQAAVEAVVVGVGGAALGVLVARGALAAAGAWIADALPRGTAVGVDWRIVTLAAVLSLATAVLFGLLPTLRTLRDDPARGLRGRGRSATGTRSVQLLRSGLVATEVALSLVLVTGSGLLLRSFLEMAGEEPGVRVEDTWVVPVRLASVDAPEIWAERMEEMRRALESLPEVERATFGMDAPFQWVGGNRCCWGSALAVPGESVPPVDVRVHAMEASFLDTYGIPLTAGTGFPRELAGAEVLPAILSQGVAVRAFGSAAAAVGREVVLGPEEATHRLRVVGVAGDTRYYGLDQAVDPGIYLPASALPFPIPMGTLAAEIGDAGPGTAGRIREAVWEAAPTVPLPTVVPLGQWVDGSSSTRRFGALILTLFGAVALALAAGGLYGTLVYSVQQRRREMGIRLALGADAGRLRRSILRKGVGVAALGAGAGVGLSLLLGRLAESLLYGVDARDPWSLGVASAVLLATAAVASWFPARRASRTDPVETLATE